MARKLAALTWQLLTRGEDYAYGRPSLTRKKLRQAELRAGAAALNGRRCQARRREFAKAREQTFREPPKRRNRVWQTDFSEFETRAGGTWQLGRRRRLRGQSLPHLPGHGVA